MKTEEWGKLNFTENMTNKLNKNELHEWSDIERLKDWNKDTRSFWVTAIKYFKNTKTEKRWKAQGLERTEWLNMTEAMKNMTDNKI
jgi:hypothetical protein